MRNLLATVLLASSIGTASADDARIIAAPKSMAEIMAEIDRDRAQLHRVLRQIDIDAAAARRDSREAIELFRFNMDRIFERLPQANQRFHQI